MEQSARCCKCHILLPRPIFDPPNSGAILKFCALYSRQIKHPRLTLLRRLQGTFEFEWQRVRRAIPCLQKYVPQAFSVLNIIPTLQEGLGTLERLLTRKPPSTFQGYLSLAFFTKAWLSLEEQPDSSGVTTALFAETAHCIAAMTQYAGRPADQPAYDLILQLLWRPHTPMASPSEAHPLFCPTYIPARAWSGKDGTGTKNTSRTHPTWVLSQVCRKIVQGKVSESMFQGIPDWTTELISRSPKAVGRLEPLSPSVRNSTTADYMIKKITWLIAAVEQSGADVQLTECSQCGKPFIGPYGVKNRNRHLSKHCKATQEGQSDYEPVKCPYCGQTYIRSDNLNQHVRRKHNTI